MDRLNQYKSKLLLFPRHGDAKKGLINDSVSEALLNEPTQNNSTGVFDLPSVKPRCKPEKLTKEMKAFKAYREIRLQRNNKKNEG